MSCCRDEEVDVAGKGHNTVVLSGCGQVVGVAFGCP